MKRTLSLLAVLLGLAFVTAWAQDPATTPDAVPQPVKLTAEEQQHVLDEMAKLVGRWKVVEVRQQEHTETPAEYTLEFQLIADHMLVIVRCQGQVSTIRTSVYPPNMMLSVVDVHAQRQTYQLQGVYQYESPTRLRINQSMIGFPKSIEEAGLSCIHLTLERLPAEPAAPAPAKEVITGRDIQATEHPFGHPLFTQAIRTDDRIIKAIEHLPIQERMDAFLKSYGLVKGDRGVMMRSPPPAAPAKQAIILIIDPAAKQSEVVKQVVEALEKAGIAKAETSDTAAPSNSKISVTLSIRPDVSFEKIKHLIEALQKVGASQIAFRAMETPADWKETHNFIRLTAQPDYSTEELLRIEQAIEASAIERGLEYLLEKQIPGQTPALTHHAATTPKQAPAATDSPARVSETKVLTVNGCTATDIARLLKHLQPDPGFQAIGNNAAFRLVLTGTPEQLQVAEATVFRLRELLTRIGQGDRKLNLLAKKLGTEHSEVLKLNAELEALDAEIVKLEAGLKHYPLRNRIEEFKTPPQPATAETEAAAEPAPIAPSDFQLKVVLNRTKPAEAARILKLVINDDRFSAESVGDNVVQVQYRSATKAEVETIASVLEQLEKLNTATKSTVPAQGTTPNDEPQSVPPSPDLGSLGISYSYSQPFKLLIAQAELQNAQLKLAKMRVHLNDQHPSVKAQELLIQELESQLRSRQELLSTLQDARSELVDKNESAKKRHGSQNPEVARLEALLAQLDARIKSVEGTLTPNPSPEGRGELEGAASVKVFDLQHAQATEVAEVLKQVYDKGPAKIVPDARTNSVIVTGPEGQLQEIEALLLKLDEAGPAAKTGIRLPRPVKQVEYKEAHPVYPVESEAAKLVVQLENELVQLLLTLGPDHPKVKELLARLDAASEKPNAGPQDPNSHGIRNQMVQHSPVAVAAKLQQLYKEGPFTISSDAQANTVVVSGPADRLQQVADIIGILDQTLTPSRTSGGLDAVKAAIGHLEVRRSTLEAQQKEHDRIQKLAIEGAIPQQRVEESTRDLSAAKHYAEVATADLQATRNQFKADLLRTMEESVEFSQKILPSDHPAIHEAETQIAGIVAQADTSPEEAQKAARELSSRLDAEAQKLVEAQLKSLESQLLPGLHTKADDRVKELQHTLAQLRRRERARTLVPGRPLSERDFIEQYHEQGFVPMSIEVSEATSKEYKQQVAQQRKDYEAADAQAHQLAAQLKALPDEERKAELQRAVQRAFAARQSLLRAELMEMQTRLLQTQRSIEMRERISDQIIQRRVEDLLNPQLKWDESTPTAPESGKPANPLAQAFHSSLPPHVWAYLGMHVSREPVGPEELKAPVPFGFRVEQVNPGGFSETAGIRVGDILISMSHPRVVSPPDSQNPFGTNWSQRGITATLLRGDKPYTAFIRPKSEAANAKPPAEVTRSASAAIPKGMRVFTFSANDTHTHAGLLRPGDRVDVTVTFADRKGNLVTKVLLECIEVFAAENKTVHSEESQNEPRPRSVSLLVTPEQDGYVKIAQAKGQLALSLRHPDDAEVKNVNGINSSIMEDLQRSIGEDERSLPLITQEQETRWRSAVVEILVSGKSDAPGNGPQKIGFGVVVAADGTMISHLGGGWSNIIKNWPNIDALFDDGSQIPLQIVEEGGSGFVVLRPKQSVNLNHHFPLSGATTGIGDQVYVGRMIQTSPDHNYYRLSATAMRLAETDRRVASLGQPVWQLALKQRIPNSLCHPVLSKDGELLAITLTDTGELLLAVPVDKLRDILPQSLGKLPTVPAAAQKSGPAAFMEKVQEILSEDAGELPAVPAKRTSAPEAAKGAEAPTDPKAAMLVKLQGIWEVEVQSLTSNLKDQRLVAQVHENLMTFSYDAPQKRPDGKNAEWSYRLEFGEPGAPQEVKLTPVQPDGVSDGLSAPHVGLPGIIEIQNDLVRLCFDPSEKHLTRPDAIAVAKDFDVYVLRRPAKPLATEPQAAMLAKLQGVWEVEVQSEDVPKEKPPFRVIAEIRDNVVTLSLDPPQPDNDKPPVFLIKLGEPGTPQPVDLVMNPNDGKDRVECPGIIEIGEATVRLCVNFDGEVYPDLKDRFFIRPEVFAVGKVATLWTLIRPAKQSPAFLGVQLVPAAVGPDQLKDTPFRGGLRIEKVYAGTPAAEGGLLAGDILVGLGAWEVAKLEDLQYALGLSLEGEVSFHVLRDGQVRKGYVLLDGSKRPASDAGLSPEQLVKLTYEYQRGHSTPASQSDPQAALLAKLQGTWDVELDGEYAAGGVGGQMLKGVRAEATIEGNLLKLWEIVPPQPGLTTETLRSQAGVMLLTVGAAGPPQQIDLVIGPNNGDKRRETQGIIEITGDTVQLCYDPQQTKGEVQRPVAFAVGKHADLLVFKRQVKASQNPGDPQVPSVDPKTAILAMLQGKLSVETTVIQDGKTTVSKPIKAVGEGIRVQFASEDGEPSGSFDFILGSAGSPQQVDLRPIGMLDTEEISKKGVPKEFFAFLEAEMIKQIPLLPGIVEVDGDCVRVSFCPEPEKSKARPTEFKAGPYSVTWEFRSQTTAAKATPLPAATAPAADNATELEGDWKLESYALKDGTPQDLSLAYAPQLVIRGAEVEYDTGRNPSKIEIDAEWKTLRYQKDSEMEPSSYRYILLGDQLTLRNAGDNLLVYRRSSTELEGDWHLESCRRVADESVVEAPPENRTFQGNQLRREYPGGQETQRIEVDPKEKRIKYFNADEKYMIIDRYDLSGDRLTCYNYGGVYISVYARGHQPITKETELEGDWHCVAYFDHEGKPQETLPSNRSFRGDQSSFVGPGYRHDCRIKVDPIKKTLWSYSKEEDGSFGQDYYELNGDQLILRNEPGAVGYQIFERGLVRIPSVVPPANEEQKLLWRSAIVEIVTYGDSHVNNGGENVVGRGVLVSPGGLILAHLAGRWEPPLKNQKVMAKFDDGSQIPLTVVEEGDGFIALQPEKPINANHYFKVSQTVVQQHDEVRIWGPDHSQAGSQSLAPYADRVTVLDRKYPALGIAVWQLHFSHHAVLGTPILDAAGDLLGITITGTRDLLLAVPVEKLKELFPRTLGQPPVTSAPSEPTADEKTRWRSAMVDLYAAKPGEDESQATRIGDGVLVTEKAEIVAYLPGKSDLASMTISAEFADGGRLDLELGEPSTRTTGNGMYCFRPKDERFRTVSNLLPFLPLAAEVPNQNVDRLYIGELLNPGTIASGEKSGVPGDLGIVNEHFANMWRMALQPRTDGTAETSEAVGRIPAGKPILNRDGELVGITLTAEPESLALPLAEIKELFPKTFSRENEVRDAGNPSP